MRASFTLDDATLDEIAQRVAVLLSQAAADALPPAPTYVTIPEAAELLRCSRQRIDDLLSSGRLSRVKEGRRTLIRRTELDLWLRNR